MLRLTSRENELAMNERTEFSNASVNHHEARAVAAARAWPSSLPQRCGGLSLEEYAVVLASRERTLDDARIELVKTEIRGDRAGAMAALEAQAKKFGVPFLAWDFERTNRIEAWDRLIVSEPRVQDAWKNAYVNAWLESHKEALDDHERATVRRALHPCVQHLWNCVMPLAQRRAGATAAIIELLDLAKQSKQQGRLTTITAPLRPATAPAPLESATAMEVLMDNDDDEVTVQRPSNPPGSDKPDDLVIFPGERLARVSDFAAITRAATHGDFQGALARAGVAPRDFAAICMRFNEVLREAPEVDVAFRAWLSVA
jgi:hypothetical protein